MAVLSTKARKALPSRDFALPGGRFPITDKAHAANAKARATQGVNAGTLSPAEAAKVRAKANKMLGGKKDNIHDGSTPEGIKATEAWRKQRIMRKRRNSLGFA